MQPVEQLRTLQPAVPMMFESGGNILLAIAIGRQHTGYTGDSHTRHLVGRLAEHGSMIVIDGFQNTH
jgi:hypothetical protein